jgi:hypothetical protein
MPLPDVDPNQWVEALLRLRVLGAWVGAVIGGIAVVRFAIVPLVRAWRCRE